MRYPDRRRSRPFDAWDPYSDDPAPRPRSRYGRRRLIRIAFPLLIAAVTLGRELWRAVAPDRPATITQSAVPLPPQPALTADRPERPDPRTALPRRAKPADNPGNWIGSDDYPPSALRENLEGVVGIRFMILPDGRVRDCVVRRSSGSALLDGTACGIFVLHALLARARPHRQGDRRDRDADRAVADTQGLSADLDIVPVIVHCGLMQTVSYSDARENLKAVMDKAVADRAPILITRQRGENVVLISADEWAGMEETLHLLASPMNAKHLLVGIAELDAGRGEEHELIRP